MLVTILRPFDAAGRSLKPGEVVDASDWPNMEPMLRVGMIRQFIPPQADYAARRPAATGRNVR